MSGWAEFSLLLLEESRNAERSQSTQGSDKRRVSQSRGSLSLSCPLSVFPYHPIGSCWPDTRPLVLVAGPVNWRVSPVATLAAVATSAAVRTSEVCGPEAVRREDE